MELYDVSGAGFVVQAVHILGDDVLSPAHALQLSQGIMSPVRSHSSKLMPPSKAPCPVPCPALFSRHELQDTLSGLWIAVMLQLTLLPKLCQLVGMLLT